MGTCDFCKNENFLLLNGFRIDLDDHEYIEILICDNCIKKKKQREIKSNKEKLECEDCEKTFDNKDICSECFCCTDCCLCNFNKN